MTHEKLEEALRGTGRSTRQADDYIQEIFNNPGKWIIIKDHYFLTHGPRLANLHLFNKIIKRLQLEHNFDFLKNKGKFEVGLYKIKYNGKEH